MTALVLLAAQLAFVACPILRDTKTNPCWLAEHEGKLYYLGVQQDNPPATLPQQSHEVLVEGTPQPGPKVCGGIPLSPVSLSVLPELTRSCNTVLTAKDEIEAPPPVAPTPAPPLTIDFDFASDQLNPAAIRTLQTLASTHPAHIEITIPHATVKLDDGRTLTEDRNLPTRRANKLTAALKALGINPATITTVPETNSVTRRATISITP
jgi:outer membrane protein OmpA-like peptidoglycan-associated protein